MIDDARFRYNLFLDSSAFKISVHVRYRVAKSIFRKIQRKYDTETK